MSEPVKPEGDQASRTVYLGHEFTLRLSNVEANQKAHEKLDQERHSRTMDGLDQVAVRLTELERKIWFVATASFAAAAAGGSAGSELLKLLFGG